MRRVILDYLRRYWWEYALAAVVLTPLWLASAARGDLFVPLAMTVAAIMGPMVTFVRLAPREVRNLPLSDAEIWQAQWIVAVPVATTVMGLSMVAGVLCWRLLSGRGEPGAETMLLSTLYVFLYVGCVTGLPPLLGKVGVTPALRRSPVGRHVANGLQLAVSATYILSIFWPFALRGHLPTRVQDLTWTTAAGLLAAASITWVVARSRSVQQLGSPERVAATPPPAWVPRLSIPDPATGIALYLWRAWFETAWRLAVLMVFLGGFWFLMGSPKDVFPFRADSDLPFVLPMLGFLLLARRDGVGGLHATNLLRASLRQFRILPIGTGAVATLMVVRRLVGWANLWTLMLLAHLLLAGSVETLRLELLLVVVGLDVLLDGLRLRWSHPAYFFLAPVVIGGLVLGVARVAWLFDWLPSGPLFGLVCLTGLLGGWLLLRHSIEGRASLYRIDAVPVGPFGVRVVR